MRQLEFGAVICLVVVIAFASFAYGGSNFKAKLSGAQEVPPVVTDTTGKAHFHIKSAETAIRFRLDIKDAVGALGAAGAHLHCAPAGFNGPVVAFLAASVPGGFDGKVQIRATLTGANIINPACGVTIADLVQAMRDGDVYVNVHSPAHPGGVIRGQVE